MPTSSFANWHFNIINIIINLIIAINVRQRKGPQQHLRKESRRPQLCLEKEQQPKQQLHKTGLLSCSFSYFRHNHHFQLHTFQKHPAPEVRFVSTVTIRSSVIFLPVVKISPEHTTYSLA